VKKDDRPPTIEEAMRARPTLEATRAALQKYLADIDQVAGCNVRLVRFVPGALNPTE